MEATATDNGSYDSVVYCTVCGAELSRETVTVPATGGEGHTHSWASAVTTAATCTEAGVRIYICSGCGASYTETIPATGHTAGEALKENVVETTTMADGSYDSVVYCTACGEEISRTTVTIPATGFRFDDVQNSGEYYYNAVYWAYDNGITTGTSDTLFSPSDSCTRAQFVTFLWRLAGEPTPTTTSCSFTDLNTGEYYYNAVLWAVEQGITNGTSDTTFSPSDTCDRAMMVTFLYRYAG
ncbi:MAG: S-layer homology domain-containing protein [Oscillospiraceae bacterium]|nr:S-layer homology domain-containing protein [Oscillospiraceae bacterium]